MLFAFFWTSRISKPPILLHLLGLQEESVELSPLGLLAALLAAFCATAVYLVIRILKEQVVNVLKRASF